MKAKLRSAEAVGDLPDLVVMPGIGNSNEIYEDMLVRLKADFRCHKLVFPREALTGGPAYSMPDLGQAVAQAIATALPGRPVTVVGFSYGGLLGWAAALALHARGHPVENVWVLDIQARRRTHDRRFWTAPLAELRYAAGYVLRHLRHRLASRHHQFLDAYASICLDVTAFPPKAEALLRRNYAAMNGFRPRVMPDLAVNVVSSSHFRRIERLPQTLGWDRIGTCGTVLALECEHVQILRDPQNLERVVNAIVSRHRLALRLAAA